MSNESTKANPIQDRKDQYVNKMKAQLDEWNAEIDKLHAKAEKAEADAKLDYDSKIRDLRKMRDDAKSQLADLQQASDDAWDRMKEGFESSWHSLRTAANEARQIMAQGS